MFKTSREKDTENLLKIYNSSEHLLDLLKDENSFHIEYEIDKLCRQAHELLNLNISYKFFIEYLLNLIDDYINIDYTEENIRQYVILSDYFQLKIQDDFFDYIISKYIFKRNVYYNKLYTYNPINYYILDKFSKENCISNLTFKYIFKTNENLCNEIKTLNSKCIEQNTLNKCINVVKLNISNNENITTVNQLRFIEDLNISGNLCGVDQDGISWLKIVKILNMSNNNKIYDLNHLQQITELDVSKTYSISQYRISSLLLIAKLNVSENDEVYEFNHLKFLIDLDISNMPDVLERYNNNCNKWQDGISNVTTIKVLNVSGNCNIKNVNHLKSLVSLNISCEKCKCCVDQNGISELLNIKVLNANNNHKITNVNHLQQLEELYISNGNSVTQEGLSDLKFVKKLNVKNNSSVTNVNHLKKIENLDISGSYCGVNQNGISQLLSIKKLNVSNNSKINDLNHLKKLEDLNITNNKNIKQNSISDLQFVKKLVATENYYLCINHLKQLEELDISSYHCGIGQDDISNLTMIKKLNVSDNRCITDVRHLKYLVNLNISGDKCKVKQDGIPSTVKKLQTVNNKNIINIQHLTMLEELNGIYV